LSIGVSVSFGSAGRCSAVCPAIDGGQQGSVRRTARSRAADSREGSEQWTVDVSVENANHRSK